MSVMQLSESRTTQVCIEANNLIVIPTLRTRQFEVELDCGAGKLEGGAALGMSLDPVLVSNKQV